MTRREAGQRSQILRKESDDRLRQELEGWHDELCAIFEISKHRVPLYPEGQSRLEWFLEYAASRDEAEIWDAMQAKADREVEALVAAFERATA